MKLKAEIKEAKYVPWEDQKLSQNNGENRKPLYKRSNRKSVDKRNLEYFNCGKKDHFKSEYRAKLKGQTRDRTDYRNIWFLETDQLEVETSSDSEIEEVNLNHQQVCIYNWKYNAAQDLW